MALCNLKKQLYKERYFIEPSRSPKTTENQFS